MKPNILIQANQLQMKFGNQLVFQQVSFQVQRGDFFSIVGPNGAGKTTLLRLILGQLKPTQGHLHLNLALQKMGYVPQFRNLDSEYPLSAQAFVELKLTHSYWPWLTASEKKQVAQALTAVHLQNQVRARVGRMSGGEKQRVYLAQALVAEPELLILDEPTASLDTQAKLEVMDVVAELNQRGTTVILITHDEALLARYSTKKLVLGATV
ncbi:ATP-binding cassette domain-containing protein [Lactobacillus sp. DCY120]|uniref:ATP-binding cassette domain-containing protein n=1 Tax=Bombilactobacillus apium TaxID=2675299 RepID=A0A850R6D6_9LACO|nr:ATP-binding cassette domain-containing protein [Bombilactobacillus apium]NVY96397.1 ATP-binding cassette domain-containing protein [Bombilactobacillus apium]